MALSTEPKMKLNLKSGFSIGGQAAAPSPPVGLKINHGKPNYTINKGVSRNGSIRVNGSTNSTSPFGVTLKKITPPSTPEVFNSPVSNGNSTTTLSNGNSNSPQVLSNENATPLVSNGNATPLVSNGNSSPPISPKPVIISRNFSTPTRTTPISPWIPPTNGASEPSRVILRSTSRASTYSNGSQEDEEPEFLRAHRRMAAKISNVDYDEINRNRNSYTEIMNVSSPKVTTKSIVPEEVEAVPEADAALVEVIENGHQEEVKEEVIENGHREEVNEEQVLGNGHQEEVVSNEEVIVNSNVEEDQPKLSPFVQQMNELIAKQTPEIDEENQDELKKQIDQTIEEAFQEVEKLSTSLIDENGNTLPEDLAKLKFDIQESQQDITVTTTIVH